MRRWFLFRWLMVVVLSGAVLAQESGTFPNAASQSSTLVPRLIRFSGVLKNAEEAPRTGVVGLTFALYKEQQGGAPLWLETQNVELDAQGRYGVLLGASKAEGLPLDLFAGNEARWLGVQIAGETESASGGRVLLVSVPYALKAAEAETLGGRPASAFLTSEMLGTSAGTLRGPNRRLGRSGANTSRQIKLSCTVGLSGCTAATIQSGIASFLAKFSDSSTLVNSLIFDTGTRVGLGTQTPFFQIDIQNTDTSAAGANLFRIQSPSVNGATMHFISTGTNGRHWGFGSNFILGLGEFGIYDYTAQASRLWIDASGRIGLGTTMPAFLLDLQNNDAGAGGAAMFRIQTPSSNGALMRFVSRAPNGREYAFGSNFILGQGEFGIYDYTALATRFFIGANGNVGIGTISPSGPLEVDGNTGTATIIGNQNATTGAVDGVDGITASTSGTGVFGSATAASGGTWGVFGRSDSTGGTGVEGFSSAASGGTIGVYGQADSSSGAGVQGYAPATSGTTFGILGQADSPSGRAVEGVATATGGIGVFGVASATSGFAVGVEGKTTSVGGAAGVLWNTAGGDILQAFSGSPAVGKLRIDGNGAISAPSGTVIISGNASVSGTLTKGAGSFKIDHPLDPAKKYLSHSFVESPDMKNIYDGVVVLDKHGQAWVQLPDYFQALNKDFRYQLTCIGGYAPVYIAQKISRNRFKIAGGRRGLEVSWQVTGTRQDAYANAHRIVVEKEKPAAERGKYLHPELFEQPESERATLQN